MELPQSPHREWPDHLYPSPAWSVLIDQVLEDGGRIEEGLPLNYELARQKLVDTILSDATKTRNNAIIPWWIWNAFEVSDPPTPAPLKGFPLIIGGADRDPGGLESWAIIGIQCGLDVDISWIAQFPNVRLIRELENALHDKEKF